MSVQIARKQFTVSEYYRMAEAGIISEDDRVELIQGEVIKMSPTCSLHAACVDRLMEFFVQQSKGAYNVRGQNPLRIDKFTEPEPDIMLLKRRNDFYAHHHPEPADVLLVIEVADTSPDYDRNIKAPLYARAGIPEMWLVDLTGETVEISAKPQKGAYKTIQKAKRGEILTPQQIAALSISVDAILG